MEALMLLFSWAPKSLQMVTTVMKLKDGDTWKESYDKPREHIKKLRHRFVTKVHIIKDVVFPVVLHGYEIWTIKKIEC